MREPAATDLTVDLDKILGPANKRGGGPGAAPAGEAAESGDAAKPETTAPAPGGAGAPRGGGRRSHGG